MCRRPRPIATATPLTRGQSRQQTKPKMWLKGIIARQVSPACTGIMLLPQYTRSRIAAWERAQGFSSPVVPEE